MNSLGTAFKSLFTSLVFVSLLSVPCFATTSDSTCYGTDAVIMLHGDGSNGGTTITDESGKTWTARGNANTSTAQQKFGTASLAFDGTGDWVDTPDSTDFDIGTGDFTVDFWFRATATGSAYPFSHGSSPSIGARFAAGKLDFYLEGSVGAGKETTTSFSTNTWYHIAATRSGTTFRLFVNGTQEATETNSANVNGATIFSVGAFNDGSNGFNGYVDEFRIVKGTAVWTGNFTSPSAAYTACTVPKRRISVSVSD